MKKTVYVQGMDCISCETVLRDALDAVPSIKVLSLTHKTGKMTIEYKSKNDLKKLKRILSEHDYSLVEEHERNNVNSQNSTMKWIEQFAIGSAILVLLWTVTKIDLTQYIGDYGPGMGLGVAFLVGLVACGSSCLAVTGGIVVSYVEALEDKNWYHLVKAQGLFHIGRMLAFILGGALLGYLGQTIQISQSVNAVMMMVVGVILAYVGLQIFGIVPSITKRGFHLPSGTEKLIKKFNDPKYALLVGALTFFLPCGFTQSMQLFAMQTGSALQGALMLGAYGLGTIPLLLGLGLSAGYFKAKMRMFNKVIAGLLMTFGLVTFANGWNASQGVITPVVEQGEIQIEVEQLARPHVGNRLEPRDILVEKDKSYEITINPSMNGIGCKSFINLPDGTNHPVRQGEPITFTFNPVQAGTYKLMCNAGSSHGSIVVQ